MRVAHFEAMSETSFRQTSTPRGVGSRCPYHHPSVGTSEAIVARGSEVGGDPSGLAGWWVGIGNCGVDIDRLPGIKFDGYTSASACFRAVIARMLGLTLEGSSPMTAGVQAMPVPKAILTNPLTTLVLPELAGPTTITLGPWVTP